MSSSTEAPVQVSPVQISPVQISPVQVSPVQVGPVQVSRIVRGSAATVAVTQAFTAVDDLDIPLAAAEAESRLNPAERAHLDQLAERTAREGFERGYADGVEAGRREAITELAGRGAMALRALNGAAEALQARDAAGLADLDDHIAGFAMQVVEELLGRDLATMADPGRDALARAIRLAPDRGTITARLHPTDLELMGALDTRAIDAIAPGRDVHLVADAGIEPGGCVVEVGSCRVDAQFGPAIDRVRAVLGLGFEDEGGAR